MAITFQRLLEFAETLLLLTNETAHRSAASRAYYSAFHASTPLGESLGIVDDGKGGMHHQLIQTFITSPVSNASRERSLKIRSIGYLLRTARARRVDADYALDFNFTLEMAQETVEISRQIGQKLTEL